MARKARKSGAKSKPAAEPDVHLIVAEDAEVTVERYPEDWLTLVIFWALAFIVFLQFFTRYVLNDSLAWTEEIARYGLIWVVFVGGIMVTRRSTHVAVELLSNVMKPSPRRVALLAFVDLSKVLFLGLLAYFSVTIIERMHQQWMTVFELQMSWVYAGVLIGCFGMFARQIQSSWRNAKAGWRTPHEMHQHISGD